APPAGGRGRWAARSAWLRSTPASPSRARWSPCGCRAAAVPRRGCSPSMPTSTRTGGGCVFEVIARSPIAPAPPVVRIDGWEVSGRRAERGLTLTDCAPLTKGQVRAPVGGLAAAALGVRFGQAARAGWAGEAGNDTAGTLVVGSGPGEWLLLAAPGRAADLDPGRLVAQAPGESVTWVDQSHGRALVRLSGSRAPSLLAKLCGIDLSDDITPDG